MELQSIVVSNARSGSESPEMLVGMQDSQAWASARMGHRHHIELLKAGDRRMCVSVLGMFVVLAVEAVLDMLD